MDKLREDPHRYPFLSGSLSPLRKMDTSTLSRQYRVAFSIDEREKNNRNHLCGAQGEFS